MGGSLHLCSTPETHPGKCLNTSGAFLSMPTLPPSELGLPESVPRCLHSRRIFKQALGTEAQHSRKPAVHM